MMPEQEIQWIAAVTAAACALPGVFLVLRRMSLMSDAISHAILLGIVLAFFVTENIASPLLVVAAAVTGVLTVSLVEVLNRTRLVREDAAIGLVFPALFSVGVILISRFAGNVHLDVDADDVEGLGVGQSHRRSPCRRRTHRPIRCESGLGRHSECPDHFRTRRTAAGHLVRPLRTRAAAN